ncbi:MAG: hypothetical protein DCC68_11405 [Planctomycetota bacterium]|nr:MAG: hypothetical protein DCC68_11405 [Planctomycetota bacterium]
MNYFAHGRAFVGDPYFLAGTAVPDWLAVVDRRVRVRAKHVEPYTRCDAVDGDWRLATIARGIAQHHADDAWFHATLAFHELSTDFTGRIRALLPSDGGHRASFLGHILVELLLDDVLIAEDPARLEAYYASIERLDFTVVEQAINRIAPRSTDRLAWFIERFSAERFLWDYRDDARLLFRLNQVMQRAALPPLPETFRDFFGEARDLVRERRDSLLTPEE